MRRAMHLHTSLPAAMAGPTSQLLRSAGQLAMGGLHYCFLFANQPKYLAPETAEQLLVRVAALGSTALKCAVLHFAELQQQHEQQGGRAQAALAAATQRRGQRLAVAAEAHSNEALNCTCTACQMEGKLMNTFGGCRQLAVVICSRTTEVSEKAKR